MVAHRIAGTTARWCCAPERILGPSLLVEDDPVGAFDMRTHRSEISSDLCRAGIGSDLVPDSLVDNDLSLLVLAHHERVRADILELHACGDDPTIAPDVVDECVDRVETLSVPVRAECFRVLGSAHALRTRGPLVEPGLVDSLVLGQLFDTIDRLRCAITGARGRFMGESAAAIVCLWRFAVRAVGGICSTLRR